METRNRFSAINRRTFTITSLASIAALKVGKSVRSQEATPMPDEGSPEAGMGMEVLATGLRDPRSIIVDGTDIYFTETGTGGDQELILPAGEGTPEPTAPVSMHGKTGRLSKYSTTDGSLTEIVSDFHSYTFGEHGEIVGAAGLALDGAGIAYVAVGSPGPFVGIMPRTGDEGVVFRVDLATGEKEIIADLLAWEIEHNPDPAAIDSNLYGMTLLDGVLYVCDAGGNSIISVDAESGEVATFAVTGGLDAPFLPETGNPARGGDMTIDSVPGSIVVGPDGRLYVSFVSGAPFVPGIVPVEAFSPDSTQENYAQGLTMVVALAFDSVGRLYACTISADFLNQAPGRIVRIEEDGSLTVVVDNLPVPNGLAFDADDNLYTTIFSAVSPDGGSLVRIAGVADIPAAGPQDATPIGDSAGGEATVVTLVNGEIQPAELTLPGNTDVTITVTNEGTFSHNFTIEGTDFATAMLDPGQSEELTVNLEAGEYVTFCAVPGHREAGMMGTLTVS